MGQNDILVDNIRGSMGFIKNTLADMTDADLLQRPVPQANNALWQLGHLITAEANMVNATAGKTVAELPTGFADKYKSTTAAENDPAKLGTKAELLSLLETNREKICTWAATLTPADMSKPAPEKLRTFCATTGHVLGLLPTHTAMHVGQFQVLRRKLGKPVLF